MARSYPCFRSNLVVWADVHFRPGSHSLPSRKDLARTVKHIQRPNAESGRAYLVQHALLGVRGGARCLDESPAPYPQGILHGYMLRGHGRTLWVGKLKHTLQRQPPGH
jgi:hypothetical protein